MFICSKNLVILKTWSKQFVSILVLSTVMAVVCLNCHRRCFVMEMMSHGWALTVHATPMHRECPMQDGVSLMGCVHIVAAHVLLNVSVMVVTVGMGLGGGAILLAH